MRKITTRWCAVILLLLPFFRPGIKAQVENGKVYYFVNVGNPSQSMATTSLERTAIAPTNAQDYSQLWLVEAGRSGTANEGQFALRNLGNGRYLRNSQATSNPWTLVKADALDENCYNYCVQAGSEGKYTFNSQNNANGSLCMHYGQGQGSIVCWSADEAATKWQIHEVTITSEDLQRNWDQIAEIENAGKNVNTYEKALKAIFEDGACTKLNSTYAGMTEEAIKADGQYQSLPLTLRDMVLKIKKNDWSEANADPSKLKWGSNYAQKFRVQLYEPYCDPNEASKALKINPHSNLNNPTGLYANNRQLLYIMVEGEIKEGAELYIGSFTGHGKPDGDFRSGARLKQGLNIVSYWADGNATHINYVVKTFENGQMTNHKLSAFKDLKIHIEGGHINGYFNVEGDKLYTKDTDNDWNYYEARANLSDITILGKYQTVQFFLEDTYDSNGNLQKGLRHYFTDHASVNKVMAEWDRIMYVERLTLGLLNEKDIKAANDKYPTLDDPNRGIYAYTGNDGDQYSKDYSDSYRLHGLSFGTTSGYMYGGGDHSGYNVNTFGDIIGKMVDEFGPTWGPAHEIGHQHQAVLNMHGLTEVSNNIFSNVAVWYKGMSTSRVNGTEGSLTSVLTAFNKEGSDFFTNNIWAQTQMYYKMWMYYHLVGHNNKFYPRLFEILRQHPMTLTAPKQDGALCLLHFYKMCCKAAGEDLTEFFRAYGFFSPMKDRFVEDYTASTYTMTQKQIDEAIKEVKSWGLPVNHEMILINDCTHEPTYGHNGTTPRALWDGNETVNAEYGGYRSFFKGQEKKVKGTYTYSVNGNTVTMSGAEGGVGFLVYNDKDELIGFSDKASFQLSTKAQLALATGKARICAANGDNTNVEAVANRQDTEKDLLKTLLDQTQAIVALSDPTNKKVGFYRGETVASLKKAYDSALKVYEANSEGSFAGAYSVLYDEYNKLKNNDLAKIGLVVGNSYKLQNKLYPTYYMSIQDNKNVVGSTTQNTDNELWYLEETAAKGSYAIKSKSKSSYLPFVARSTQLNANAENGSSTYIIQDMGNAYFAFTTKQDKNQQSLHCDGGKKIVGWDASSDGSQWRIEAVDIHTENAAKADLTVMTQEAEALVAQMAITTTEIKLQTLKENEAGYLYCNAPYTGKNSDESTPENGYNLLDNDINTHLHTDYSGKKSDDYHYLCVDLGEGKQLSSFVLNYETRNGGNREKPKVIEIAGRNQASENYTVFNTLNTGLPETNGTKFQQKITSASPYRYFRFMVKETYGNAKGDGVHPYFTMASFGLSYSKVVVEKVDEAFKSHTEAIEKVANDIHTAQNAQSAEEIQNAKAALETSYQALLAIKNQVEQSHMTAKKEQLEALIAETNALTGTTGNKVETFEQVALQTEQQQNAGYLSSNADHNTGGKGTDGGGIAALVDNSDDTYFHSRWGSDGKPEHAVNEAHFIQVDLGQDAAMASFKFNYKTRKTNNATYTSPAPTQITVSGSNEPNGPFTQLQVFTKDANGLPAYSELGGVEWISPVITAAQPYRYLRFTVNDSQGPAGNEWNGHKFFAMSHFGLEKVTNQIQINEGLSCVNEEQWEDCHYGVGAAQSISTMALTVEQLDEAIADLTQKSELLKKSKEASPAYNTLDSYYNGSTPLIKETITGGSNPGFYPVESANAYNAAYADATEKAGSKSFSKTEYESAYNNLKSSFEGLHLNLPQSGKLYTLRCAHKGYAKDHLAYVGEDQKMYHSATADKANRSTIWTLEPTTDNKYRLVNLSNGDGVKNFINNDPTPLNHEVKPITISSLNYAGQVKITAEGNTVMHAQENRNAIVTWNEGKDSPSAWYIEEVEIPKDFKLDVKVSKYQLAGYYQNFNAAIPAGVKAYIVSEVTNDRVALSQLNGNIIPANTGVIIEAAPETTQTFYYTKETPETEVTSQLSGSAYLKYIQGAPGQDYYLFGAKGGNVGLYKTWLQYGADGSLLEENKGTNNGQHFKVSANKVYLSLPEGVAPTHLSFDFDGITGIDQIEQYDANDSNNKEAVIYDMQGRRIYQIQSSGLYIINGQKTLIKK